MRRCIRVFCKKTSHVKSRPNVTSPPSRGAPRKSPSDQPTRKQVDELLTFSAVSSRVTRKERLIVLSTHAGSSPEAHSFSIVCSNQLFSSVLQNDIIDDWPGPVRTGHAAKVDPSGSFLSFNGPDICTYPPNALRVSHPLLKLKRALADYSVPRALDIRQIDPDVYVPVRSRGDFRCLSFRGGKAYQWILESKTGKIRRGDDFCEIKHTRSLSKRFSLDSRAAVRGPAVVTSDDKRNWIFIDFHPEGTELRLLSETAQDLSLHPERYRNESYFALWSQMASFFRLAFANQALRVENPWLGELRVLHPKYDADTAQLDAEPFCLHCTAVCRADTGETLLIVGPRASGKRTLAHHLLSCSPHTQLVSSECAVLSLQHTTENSSAVAITGSPIFHTVRVGTAIGSLFPNPPLEKCISPDFARDYLANNSEKALWEIQREVPVNITRCYGPNRTRVPHTSTISAVLMLNWDTKRSRLTNDPRLQTLMRADPPVPARWTALESGLFYHVALPPPRFAGERSISTVPDALRVEQSAVAQALVGEKLRYRGVKAVDTREVTPKPTRWYEIGGEVNFERAVKFCATKIMQTAYVPPPGI